MISSINDATATKTSLLYEMNHSSIVLVGINSKIAAM
jgi:hypothetical protein